MGLSLREGQDGASPHRPRRDGVCCIHVCDSTEGGDQEAVPDAGADDICLLPVPQGERFLLRWCAEPRQAGSSVFSTVFVKEQNSVNIHRPSLLGVSSEVPDLLDASLGKFTS